MREFTEARDWARFHDLKSLTLALVGEVGELAELVQWLPSGRTSRRAEAAAPRPRSARSWPTSCCTSCGWPTSLGVDLADGCAAQAARQRSALLAGGPSGVAAG